MSRNRLAFTLLGAHAVSGCAHHALPPEVPGMPEPLAARAATAMLEPRPRPVRHGQKSLLIPSGEQCLEELADARVKFDALMPTPGVTTPVAVKGPIGGVSYETAGKTPLVCDCRLAVALGQVAPDLLALGVTKVRYSGAYVYRTQRSGRPSLHAAGLAIDVHELTVGDEHFAVEKNYVRGAGPSCSAELPLPNRLSCELGRTGLFEEIITPDDNSDHRDHVHLAIAPL